MTHYVRADRPMLDTSQAASILLVDDRPDKLLALETILEGLHQNLVKVRSGDEALRQLLLQDFAVIFDFAGRTRQFFAASRAHSRTSTASISGAASAPGSRHWF